jgi:phenylacetate-coenzyme A ligase PaaK-like adenylate-forming protein
MPEAGDAAMDSERYFDTLAVRTVRNAAAMPFYRARWPADAVRAVRGAADLRRLPVIHRHEVQAAAGRGFGDPGEFPLIHHTKGSSGTGLLYRFRSIAEIEFLQEFFLRANAASGSGTSDLVLLQEMDAYHGTPVPLPMRGLVLQVASDRKGIDHFAELLATDFPVSGGEVRINAFSGTPAFLFLATLNLLRLGRDPAAHRLRAIATSGGFLSSARKRFLEAQWQCPVISHFSLSEIFASAMNVDGDNSFLFRPTVLTEFLDPETAEPVESGVATLVLTELAPFVTAQPLIRYWTGDLVIPGPARGAPWLRSFSPIGRLDAAIRAPGGGILIAEHVLLEALEETDALAWTHYQPWITAMFGRVPIDLPHVSIASAPHDGVFEVTIEIETVHSPYWAPEAARAAADGLRRRLIEASPPLAAGEAAGSCRLVVRAAAAVVPGAIEY